MIGKLFNNRYQIIEKLGAGGTAIVYRGQDTLLNRMVTVKILREEYASNNDFVRRFRHEAQAVASLSHGNIVAVYDVGFEENMHYIVMEFVEGESLKEYIKRKGVLKLSEACNIITQILSGVQHAHEHGIVHRDIKPHNILLGRDGRAKVTDFGIAVGMSDVTLTYNTTSRIMGSVHYISPEQVQGQPVTEKSDIYSVGVVFYEMLTGRLPFVGETPISIAMQHVQGELILPHQVNPEVPMGISYVVMRAMRKNPETRYEHAQEMAAAVRAAYQGSMDGIMPPAAAEEREPAKPPLLSMLGKGSKQAAAGHEPGPERRLQRSRLLMLGLALVLLVAIVLVAGRVINFLNPAEEKTLVPQVVGLTQEQAEAELTAAKLTFTVIMRTSLDAAAGIVIAQSIADGQEVTVGRSIELTVSEGAPKVELPDMVGTTEGIATISLENLGLVPIVEREFNDQVPKKVVIMQSPAGGAGVQVSSGSEVLLLVSQGKEPVKFIMPELVGKTLDEAMEIIREKELELLSYTPAASYVYEANIVIGQSISAGADTQTGESITLTVSEGPGPTLKLYPLHYTLPRLYDEDEEEYVNSKHNVIVMVNDVKGTREAFNQFLEGGETLEINVEYYNEGTIDLIIDEIAVRSVGVN